MKCLPINRNIGWWHPRQPAGFLVALSSMAHRYWTQDHGCLSECPEQLLPLTRLWLCGDFSHPSSQQNLAQCYTFTEQSVCVRTRVHVRVHACLCVVCSICLHGEMGKLVCIYMQRSEVSTRYLHRVLPSYSLRRCLHLARSLPLVLVGWPLCSRDLCIILATVSS